MFTFNITDYHKVGGYIINNVKTDNIGYALL